MNREIKFKAQRVDNKEWIYGSLIQEEKCMIGQPIEVAINQRGKSDYYIYPLKAIEGRGIAVIPETVCEYINKKDKNKKEIYEGHILLKRVYDGVKEYDLKTLVVFNDTGFYAEVISGSTEEYKGDIISLPGTMGEIIGNKFSNPELLEVKSDE